MASLKELYVRRKKLAEFSVLAGVSEEYPSGYLGFCGSLQRVAKICI